MSTYWVEYNPENRWAVRGELTRYNITQDCWSLHVSQVLSQLNKEQPIIIELGAVERVDSAGLAWLINLVRDAKKYGFTVIFNDIPQELNNLAKISDASALLPVQ